jgi:hypothetical protein
MAMYVTRGRLQSLVDAAAKVDDDNALEVAWT